MNAQARSETDPKLYVVAVIALTVVAVLAIVALTIFAPDNPSLDDAIGHIMTLIVPSVIGLMALLKVLEANEQAQANHAQTQSNAAAIETLSGHINGQEQARRAAEQEASYLRGKHDALSASLATVKAALAVTSTDAQGNGYAKALGERMQVINAQLAEIEAQLGPSAEPG